MGTVPAKCQCCNRTTTAAHGSEEGPNGSDLDESRRKKCRFFAGKVRVSGLSVAPEFARIRARSAHFGEKFWTTLAPHEAVLPSAPPPRVEPLQKFPELTPRRFPELSNKTTRSLETAMCRKRAQQTAGLPCSVLRRLIALVPTVNSDALSGFRGARGRRRCAPAEKRCHWALWGRKRK